VRPEKLLALVIPEVAEMQPHLGCLLLRFLLVHFLIAEREGCTLTDLPSVSSRTSVPTASPFIGVRKHTESLLLSSWFFNTPQMD
jgi:hypothetical protein